MLGVLVIIALLIFVPDDHQGAGFVFGERINNTGFDGGATGGFAFWFLVMPIGFLLTMYTQTGYDASAHTAEETQGAAIARGTGRVAVRVLLGGDRLVRAARAAVRGDRRRRGQRWRRRLDPDHHDAPDLVGGQGGAHDRDHRPAVLRDGRPHQRLAHVVRVLARPGDAGLVAVPAPQPPPGPVLRGARRHVVRAAHQHPGPVGQRGGLPVRVLRADRDLHRRPVPRVRHPGLPAHPNKDRFEPGPWNLGRHYRWINSGAVFFGVVW